MHFHFACLLLATSVAATIATLGVDVSTAVSKDKWECIKREDYQFAIVRVYQSTGNIDRSAARTIKNARAAGIKYVDGYIFPCPKCEKGAKQQVKEALDNLKRNDAKIGQLWLDVEGPQFWGPSNPANHRRNVKFIKDMIAQAKAQGVKVAMYTSQSQWKPITGGSDDFKDLQVWYAHYDKKPNFGDFKPFGGWTKPTIKQFEGNVKVCQIGVDKNWYP